MAGRSSSQAAPYTMKGTREWNMKGPDGRGGRDWMAEAEEAEGRGRGKIEGEVNVKNNVAERPGKGGRIETKGT
jgi:hypothetical protein